MNIGAVIRCDYKKPVVKTANDIMEIELLDGKRKRIMEIEWYTTDGGKTYRLYVDNSFIKQVEV